MSQIGTENTPESRKRSRQYNDDKRKTKRKTQQIFPRLNENMTFEPLNTGSLNGIIYKVYLPTSFFDKEPKYILKVEKKNGIHIPDNLQYEFLMGSSYLNLQRKYFPCFLKTHTLLVFDQNNGSSNQQVQLLKRKLDKKHLVNETNKLKIQQDVQYIINYDIETKVNITHETALQGSNDHDYGILLDYVNGQTLSNHPKQENILNDPRYFFQIYAVLVALEGKFEHRDLHRNNIMIYTFPQNKEATFTYTWTLPRTKETKKTTFTCPYLVKMIDYGRVLDDEMIGFNQHLIQSDKKTREQYDSVIKNTALQYPNNDSFLLDFLDYIDVVDPNKNSIPRDKGILNTIDHLIRIRNSSNTSSHDDKTIIYTLIIDARVLGDDKDRIPMELKDVNNRSIENPFIFDAILVHDAIANLNDDLVQEGKEEEGGKRKKSRTKRTRKQKQKTKKKKRVRKTVRKKI